MTTDAKIQPAFTTGEWNRPTDAVIDGYVDESLDVIDVRLASAGIGNDSTKDRRLLAAKLLHGQPFGFTREDVIELDFLIEAAKREWHEGDETTFLRSLKARIDALLPPE